MTIVISQSGDKVINADKIVAFEVQETSYLDRNGFYGEIVINYLIYVDCGTGSKVIGSFCNKEKAMDVLKEIMYAIQSGTDYSLPKDEDLE